MYGDEPAPSQNDVEIDAIYVDYDNNHNIKVQLEEFSKPFWIPRRGLKLRHTHDICKAGAYVVLTMSERRAVSLGLA